MSLAGTEPRHRWWIIAVIVVALAVIATSAAVISINLNRAAPAAAATLTLEPAAAPGPNPFTDSIATGTPPAEAPVVRTKSAALRQTLPTDKDSHLFVAAGTTPGLYGGSGQLRVCDPQLLVKYLAEHPDKAAAWAGVQGISPDRIAGFLDKLIPVVLNGDTLVENHGFVDGKAFAHPSVLQAGTAVMVDATGTPRVKCNCGNPLSAPELLDVAKVPVSGAPWPGYAPAQVTIVEPGTATNTLTLVDVATGATFISSAQDGTVQWVSATTRFSGQVPYSTAINTSADGRKWTKVGTIPGTVAHKLAPGNGVWVAATREFTTLNQSEAPGRLYVSADLHTWKPVESVPSAITDVAFGSGHWIAVGTDGPVNAPVPVAWKSHDGTHWTRAALSGIAGNGPGQLIQSLAYGEGRWNAVFSPFRPATTPDPAISGTFTMNTGTSPDGLDWSSTTRGTSVPLTGHIAYGAGNWLATDNRNSARAYPIDPGVHLSSNGSSWKTVATSGIGQNDLGPIAFGNGAWLGGVRELSVGPGNTGMTETDSIISSSNGIHWSKLARLSDPALALAFGPAPVASTPPLTVPPATATPSPQQDASGQWVAAFMKNSQGLASTSMISTSPDGRVWKEVGKIPDRWVSDLTEGDGVWIAVASQPWLYGRIPAPSQLYASTDLHIWRLVSDQPSAHITDVGFGSGQWIATGIDTAATSASGGWRNLAWSSSDGTHWTPAQLSGAVSPDGPQSVTSLDYGGGGWNGVLTAQRQFGQTNPPSGGSYAVATGRSSDGLSWTGTGKSSPNAVMLTGEIAYGNGSWILADNHPISADANADPGFELSTDGTTWRTAPATGIGGNRITRVAFGNGRWLASTSPNPDTSAYDKGFGSTSLFGSDDATSWSIQSRFAGPMDALAFGPAPVTQASEPAPQSTPAPATPPPPTPAPAQTPPAAATPSSGSTAPAVSCTASFVASIINNGRAADQQVRLDPQAFRCSGPWIVAGAIVKQGDEVTLLLHRDAGIWNPADRNAVCATKKLPADIAGITCGSN